MIAALQSRAEAIDVGGARSSAVVVGLGKTGLSCVRFLVDHGYDVKVADSRATPPMKTQFMGQYPDVPLHIGFDLEYLVGTDIIVVSPGVSIHEPGIQQARQQGVELAGDVELFARHVQAPVIAVTGSNGKSTVTALVGEMCRMAGLDAPLAGNIGVPVLDLLAPGQQVPDWYVLELSSFQLETTSTLRPKAAAVLNVSPDHMDRYPDMNAYAQAKARIFHGDGVAVVNRDDPATMNLVPPARSTLTFGCSAPQRDDEFGLTVHDDTLWLARGEVKLMPREQVPLLGRHNLANVLAAMALASVVAPPHRVSAGSRRGSLGERFEGH
jgi:UDP-N-acetylmuramoylalanine--D-glutamate ligase